MNRIVAYLIILIVFISCGDRNEPMSSDDPSDLVVTINNINDGSGLVTIQAYANNTTEYHFFMGENETEDPNKNNEGEFEYHYSEIGSYEIEVRAYGASGRYIKKVKRIVVIVGTLNTTGEGYTTPLAYEGMDLVWLDEFEGEDLKEDNWTYDIGTGCPNLCGWGNNELEYYRSQNVDVTGGVLTIEARKENYEGSDYTSGKIVSRGRQSFVYGRIDIRALLPKGQGIWPALWLLGENHDQVGWPKCGEIDIMEMVGGQGKENTTHGNMFWYENGTKDQVASYTLDSATFNDQFHVFTLIWDEQSVRYLVDDVPFHELSITGEYKQAFHKPFYMIMNVAVGGNWPGSPDSSTEFPTQMYVDYIRVFQKS